MAPDAVRRFRGANASPSAANYVRALLHAAGGNLSQAIFGYKHSQPYVDDVLAHARTYTGPDDTALTALADGAEGIDAPAGLAELRIAERPTEARAYRALPAWAQAGGRASALVDAHLYSDAVWLLRRYHLQVTAAREAGHRTHGDGTALDLINADGTTQPIWDNSTGRLASDLGGTPACARSGTRAACRLVPAIQFLGEDGYPGHGSPRTCSGRCHTQPAYLMALPVHGTSGLRRPACR